MKIIRDLLLAAVLFCSCSQKESVETLSDVNFTRSDFKEQKNLENPEVIRFDTEDNPLNPTYMKVLRDSLVVLCNDFDSDYAMEIYSMNSLQPIGKYISKAEAGNGLSSGVPAIYTNTSDDFLVYEQMKNAYYKVNLGTLLEKGKLEYTSKFYASPMLRWGLTVCDWDSETYVGCNLYGCGNPDYDNQTPEFAFLKKTSDENGEIMDDEREYDYFVYAINGACLFKNPETSQLWAADIHTDRIRIFDDSLKLVRTLTGPDNLQPEYEIKDSSAPMKLVTHKDNKEWLSYQDYFISSKYIYLLYANNQDYRVEDSSTYTKSEVLKLDFKGNLVSCYQLDRSVSCISVDTKDSNLYGLWKDKDAIEQYSQAELVRYSLE